MQELETLLNSLIQRGWKPWGKDAHKMIIVPKEQFNKDRNLFIDIYFSNGFSMYYSYRELVSLESGLWQFCMENGLLNSPDQYPHKDYRAKNPHPYGEMSLRWDFYYKTEVYQYRLLESALIPEEELAKFLVDNIKVEGK